MTDLRVTLDRVQVPNEDCNRAPAEFSENTDQCHVLLELREAAGGAYGPKDQRQLRFDRAGDTFVLSSKAVRVTDEFVNSTEDIGWFHRHDNADQILDIMKISGSMLPSRGIAKPTAEERADRFVFPLVIAQYVVRGEVYFPHAAKAAAAEDLAAKLLDVYANSNPDAVQSLIGKIAFFEADPKLNDEMKGRVRKILDILRLVPTYQRFLETLSAASTTDLSDEASARANGDLQTFAAAALVDLGAKGRIRYDERAVDAERAFRDLWGAKIQDKAFCEALGKALGKIPELARKAKSDEVAACREGLVAARLGPEDSVRYGLKAYLSSTEGLAAIQAAIEKETSRANMPANWLASRGQIDAVAAAVLSGAEIHAAEAGKRPRLRVDAEALQSALEKLFRETKNTRHREPLLAAIGVLRVVFGPDSDRSEAILLRSGTRQSAELNFDGEAMQEVQKDLAADFRKSMRGSELWLPLGEGAILAGGAVQLGLALGMKDLYDRPRHTLGFSGSALLGIGIGALTTHYLLPPISKKMKRPVRNRYLWDLAGGLLGGAIGAGIWGLANFAGRGAGGGMSGSPSRFPVDEYGP